MRTTVTLDPDVRALVERLMADRGLSFKAALNDAVRRGLAPRAAVPTPPTRVRDLGQPRVDLVKALAVAAALEDEALALKLDDGR